MRIERGIGMENKGVVTQIVGPVVDARFGEGQIPSILNALEVECSGRTIVLEVLQHIGDNRVRCVAMAATEGLARGLEVRDTGHPIRVPVGEAVLGRMFSVTGQPIDACGAFSADEYASIHRAAPGFDQQKPATEVFETGIKVIDLIAPYT
ncbi:MAG: F0F1 ATP synthase subunit beta, partial [Spirochaetales bacterium]|nr:F0F1 ATP synthase subunit beta [Spirochaetales bacterium]